VLQKKPDVQGSRCDYVLSGTLERFPKLRFAYAEGQVGWMPYVIERMDKLREERDADTTFPPTRKVATRITSKAGLDENEIYRLLRGNAIEAYGLGRFGIDR